MKKCLGLIMSTMLCVGALSGCGGSDTSSSTEDSSNNDSTASSSTSFGTENGNEFAEGMEFILGFDAAYPPYGFMDDSGEYVGFDIELAEEVCERLGWELIKQPIDWNAKDMELNSGAIDVIWNGFTMTGREDSYTFSDPYVDNSIVFVTRSGDNLNTKDDLAGTIVMTQAESSAHTALESDENADLTSSFAGFELTGDYNTAFMSLESGAIDAIAVDIGVAQYQLTSRDNDVFVMMEEPLSTEEYAIGFRKGETDFRDVVQDTLNDMVDDGTFSSIVDNYADYNLDQMVSLGK